MNTEGYQCCYPNCFKNYSSKHNLLRHIESYHLQVKKFSCAHCPVRFESDSKLRNHLLLQHNIKPFECAECKKRFRTRSKLRLHKSQNMNGLCAIRAGIFDIQLTTMLKNEEELRKQTTVLEEEVPQEPTKLVLLP